MPIVNIHYRRPPVREEVFVQTLVQRAPDVVVTYLDRTPLRRPLEVDGRVILENGSPVVWFTFPGLWHDIGRFHTADGTFTGVYANILTPVRFLDDSEWATTDLFLDLWLDPSGRATLLDEDEFERAVAHGWIDARTAGAARAEAANLLTLAELKAWPPPIVEEWTLERVRESIAG